MHYSFTLITGSTLILASATGISAQNHTYNSNSTNTPIFNNLLPGCCNKDYPSASEGKVHSLLTTSANSTGTTNLTPFSGIANAPAGAWKWNFAAVQLNSSVANGVEGVRSAQFAVSNWLDAPGLWDDDNAKWDNDFELCASQITFFSPASDKERLGYNSTISNGVNEYGGCETAFEKDTCAKDLVDQIKKLYRKGGCSALGGLQIDAKCAPNQGTMSKPFLVKKGKAGMEEFQQRFFISSAGRREGVTLNKGATEDKKNMETVFGAVVNEVRPLVMVQKMKSGGDPNVRLACVKGEQVTRESLDVIAGPEDDSAAKRIAATAFTGGLVGLVAGVMLLL